MFQWVDLREPGEMIGRHEYKYISVRCLRQSTQVIDCDRLKFLLRREETR